MELPALKPDALSRLIGKTCDIAVLINAQGVVQDVSLLRPELTVLACEKWLGQAWVDVVTSESRPKVAEVIAAADQAHETVWRHINHPVAGAPDMAIQYTAFALGTDGNILLLGRDLEALAVLQRRLVETQQSMERDFVRLRHAESRYRILLDTSREPVLLVDANNDKVLDANLSAQALMKDSSRRLVGREVMDLFDGDNLEDLRACLRMALATGRIEMCRTRLAQTLSDCTVSCVVFRQESGPQLLLRVYSQEASAGAETFSGEDSREILQRAPVGVVLTDRQGRIQEANEEFLMLVGALSASQLQGHLLESLLQRDSVDWGVLSTHLRQQHLVKGFATELRTLSGLNVGVELSAIHLEDAQRGYAFFVRDIERQRPQEKPAATVGMAGTVTELSHLVGRMPMKDIVGETTDMIERSCIQTALTLTQNNRASAAEMLGLSRQSLYVKLRRFGMVSEEESV